jgi:predicted ATPase/class 3 adenylate cyclase/DNA-binding CsgD family transcriptional regulator
MPDLPTGTVTLLFTDIEGSTRLLQQLGERYAEVLSECRQLLRAVFQQWNGHEVDTQGDSFFVVFARATDAISAVVAMQRTLATHAWPDGVTIPVRMGLHTGEPLRTAEGYVGLEVHHATRIMSVGHGGQVLLSQTTCELVKQNLPDGVSLRDLGEHRLKDLQRPGRLFQLVMKGLPAEFAPLKSLNNRPNNLPIQLTQLIGREQEVATALNFLQREHVRLLTLTGPGGTGKTRLALQVAAELSEGFSDGVYFVNLAPISDPELVVPAIAQTLDIKEIADQTLLNLLKASLQCKQVLLLLDNFEQVVGAAVYVSELLAACPMLKVIVTSRAALHVRGEQEFAVPPLAVPDPKHLPDLVTLSQYEAVALFIQRAQAVKPEFQVTNSNAPTVAEICARLDGLPLAIELAAARIKVLPPQALLARLGQRLAVLTSGARDAPARQQTLRNTIEWSYQLLNAYEQQLFQRLSVFVGGCMFEAIEAVCTELDIESIAGQVLDGVASLIDKSLLQQMEQEDGEPRLVMLETIREYAVECLATSGETEAAWQAYAIYYLSLAEKFETDFGGPQQVISTMRLKSERENLRAALYGLIEHEERESALRLSGALWRFWRVYGPVREGLDWLEKAISGSDGVQAWVHAKALYAAGELALLLSDDGRATVRGEESLLLYRELGDKRGIAASLMMLGQAASVRGDFVAAFALHEESLMLRRELADRLGIADSLVHLGWTFFMRGDFAKAGEQYKKSLQIYRDLGDREAIETVLASLADVTSLQGEYSRAHTLAQECLELSKALEDRMGIAGSLIQLARTAFLQGNLEQVLPLLEESLAIVREVGDKLYLASALCLLGEIIMCKGDATRARSSLEESMILYKEVGSWRGMAQSLSVLARAATCEGDYTAAHVLYEESLAIARKVGNKWLIASCLEGLAAVVVAQGEPLWAARLWGAAEALRDVIGAPLPPAYRADYERGVAAARAQLGEKAFATDWAEGRTMTPDQALTAQGPTLGSSSSSTGERTSAPPAMSTATYPDGLTSREVEVLRLVAQGLADVKIAEQLIISPRTVNSHLTSIYGKIGVSSRTAATCYAIEHHLV